MDKLKVVSFVRALALVTVSAAAPACGDDDDDKGDATTATSADAKDVDDGEVDEETFVIGPLAPPVFG